MTALRRVLIALLLGLGYACGADDTGCPEGSTQCACLPSGGCDAGLSCQAGVCSPVVCPAGIEGCDCLEGSCGRTSGGQPLTCNAANMCESESCPVGQLGCACGGGSQCMGMSACVDGLCRARTCIPGELGCECLAGSCDPGLACSGNVCIDQTGQVGGGCRSNNTCSTNARCDQTLNPARCVYCDLGTLGCQCDSGESCLPGLSCTNGLCAGDEVVQKRTPPASPKCYTPCSGDLVEEGGEVRRCNPDGYMDGCLDNLVCEMGECKLPSEPRRMCTSDGECPEFQQCMQGYCYSNCDTDADCSDALSCFRHVCRTRCSVGISDDCPTGTICESEDNVAGYCMASTTPDVTANFVPDTGTFQVTQPVLGFSNVETTKEFQLINRSTGFVNFTVTKASHGLNRQDGSSENIDLPPDGTCTGIACPLWWMEMGEFGFISSDTSIDVRVPPNCENDESCPTITVRLAGEGVNAVRWRGIIKVESPLGSQNVDLSYVAQAEGQWAGRMVYFANFDDAGIDSTEQGGIGWLDRPRRFVEARQGQVRDVAVANGLIQRWGAFRNGGLGGGWREMLAVLVATESEQWRWPSVSRDCVARLGACYLFGQGVPNAFPVPYVTNLESSPIPTGVSSFPMAINVYAPDPSAPEELVGRVVSNTALHYPGDPLVEMRFEEDPGAVDSCSPTVRDNCVTFLQTPTGSGERDGLLLDIDIGGRYPKPRDAACAGGFVEQDMPWLVPGFLADVEIDGGFYEQKWCVDFRLPGYDAPIENIEPDVQIENRSLALGNPIPNGEIIRRRVKLLDGAMIDQSTVFIIFRETFPSFLGGEDLTAYGYMLLERRPVDLDRQDSNTNGVPDDYEGNRQPDGLMGGGVPPSVQCSEDILDLLGVDVVTSANADSIVANLVAGGNPDPQDAIVPPSGSVFGCTPSLGSEVHYLCEDTGLFNGGFENASCWGSGGWDNDDSCGRSLNGECNDGGAGSVDGVCGLGTDVTDCGNRYRDARIACPLESNVTFFTASATEHNRIVYHVCQNTGTCASVLQNWTASGSVVTQLDPTFTCTQGEVCDFDPLDRRAGKTFYRPNNQNVYFTGLRASIADAFRYKTRFRNREGTNLGFTPSLCQPISTSEPYCYDPVGIEEIRDRVDCLASIYEAFYSDPNDPDQSTLFDYLAENFADYSPGPVTGEEPREGFEKLYSELLIMLGDEAYTNAFESRFDLAGLSTAGFPGDQFEDDGLAISGIAGYEMFTLHQAVQYYSMALDRFYRLSQVISASLESGSPELARNFLSSDTVTLYFDRLIRASTQRSRAWAEIARRYQGFNESGLARRVATRAYNQTYLESVALANVINRLYDISGGTNKPQLLIELERAQKRYSMALLDLGNVYQSITDEVNILGFSPDYVPFPALGTGGANVDINAFERIYQFAQTKLDVARRREETALNETRSFDTDEASFQAELTRLSRTYESQLGDLCGVFTGVDGQVYPAIEEFAFLSEQYAEYGDPCGFVGNGRIHEQIVQMDLARLDMRSVITQIENLQTRIRNQEKRVEDVCKIQASIANANFVTAQESFNVQEEIVLSENLLKAGLQVFDTAVSVAQTLSCAPLECPSAAVGAGTILSASAIQVEGTLVQQGIAAGLRDEKASLERANARWVELQQCTIARTEIFYEIQNQLLQLKELQLSLLSAQLRLGLALSEVSKTRQVARRTELERDEALELSINVQAARNNPNIRIYRNDAVLNAELAFRDALEEAYRLTLVYEYYTSQSYAARDQLFLTRMVSAGDFNLENYITEIRNDFLSFEEVYGNPDTRVIQISLRDDLFDIPRVGSNGKPLGVNSRAAIMRDLLRDPQYLNSDGYLTVPFSTRLQSVSPLTRNHKIFYVEANVEGNDIGDFVGRVYLRQRGTSTVDTVDGGQLFYRFPQRTAVINPYFNSIREFTQEPGVYRSFRLRDLPLINDTWELIFNQRDEEANLDINFDQLTDIKLYIFYTDFTVY